MKVIQVCAALAAASLLSGCATAQLKPPTAPVAAAPLHAPHARHRAAPPAVAPNPASVAPQAPETPPAPAPVPSRWHLKFFH